MLMIELYQIKNELAPPIMDSVLNRRNITYKFRNLLLAFQLDKKKTDFYGLVFSTVHRTHGHFCQR